MTAQIQWQTVGLSPKFLPDEIHIWRADLHLVKSQLADLWEILDVDEKARAKRFKFAIHRERFIATKGTLRKILGKYLNISPQAIQFSYGPHGKPFLANSELMFNNSASNDLALYALAHYQPVGIDVEYIDKEVDYAGIVERFFSVNENKIFQQLPKLQQKLAFFNAWVQKEAFVKATGEGLSFHLNKFEVNLMPDEAAKLITVEDNKQRAKDWQLLSFEPLPNFVACLAVKSSSGLSKNFSKIKFLNVSNSLNKVDL